MATAIYPGSFDPVTYGHIDIMRRACKLVDKLYVAVLVNNSKTPLFSTDERVTMLKEVTKDMPNVEILTFEGLTVEFAKKINAQFMVRGLRAISDFDFELQLAQTNSKLCDEVDTIFLPTSLEYAFLSSRTVKEVASFDGDISQFVPPYVEEKLREKYQNK